MPSYPRPGWRVKASGPGLPRRGIVLLAFALTLAPTFAVAAPVGKPAHRRHHRPPPLVRVEVGARWLGAPAGRWNLEQRSFGAGVSIQPQRWLVLRSAIEVSTTQIEARKLHADPFQVRTRLDARRSWGFSHALSVRTHQFGAARLEMFGEVRWMPGTSALRILQLVLDPGAFDLALLGRLSDLARARFSWWQGAAGARFGVRTGPVDAWIDAGALWVRLGLRYTLREQALALGRLAAPDGRVDSQGNFSIQEGQPFARAGLRLDLPGPVMLTGTGTAIPTRHGVAHGVTIGASWAL